MSRRNYREIYKNVDIDSVDFEEIISYDPTIEDTNPFNKFPISELPINYNPLQWATLCLSALGLIYTEEEVENLISEFRIKGIDDCGVGFDDRDYYAIVGRTDNPANMFFSAVKDYPLAKIGFNQNTEQQDIIYKTKPKRHHIFYYTEARELPTFEYFCKHLTGNVYNLFEDFIFYLFENATSADFDHKTFQTSTEMFGIPFIQKTRGNNYYLDNEETAKLKHYYSKKGFPYQPTWEEYIRFIQNNNSMTRKHFKGSILNRFMSKTLLQIEPLKIHANTLLHLLLPVKVSHKNFYCHSHIIGRSGSGKTELLKTVLYMLIEGSGHGAVVIDPHGDLADFYRHNVYYRIIAPLERRFVVNPFDIEDKSTENRELVTSEILQLFDEILQDTSLSYLMRTISYPIIATLLKLDYADFSMFRDCINPADTSYLEKLTPYVDEHLLSFWERIISDDFKTTKLAIYSRLQGLLNSSLITKTLCGRDDFKNAILECHNPNEWNGGREKKGLVISLPIPQMGEDIAQVIGKFFMCRMQIWAKHRQKLPEDKRNPVFLMVDECQNFLSNETAKTLDQFGRKFGLYMILAHQHIKQIDNRGLRESILTNCKNIISGDGGDDTRAVMAKAIGVEKDSLILETGYYIGRFDKEIIPFYARRTTFSNSVIKDFDNFCQTVNTKDYINGWELVNLANTQKTSYSTPKNAPFTPKHDL